MSRRRDLTYADLNTGTIRQRFPRHYRKQSKRSTLPQPGDYCLDCGKQSYKTEEAARTAIGSMACAGRFVETTSFAVRPYICPHGWWHFGRDYKTVEHFRKLAKKKTALIPA